MPLTLAETPLYYRDSQGQYHRIMSGADMTGYRTAAAQDAIDESRAFEHATSGFRWYVDGTNGDDANPGTQDAPWKTMDKFFSMANSTANGRADIRCFIVSAGTYDITQQTFTALAIHITGVDGVILNFTTFADVKFYECHVNLNTLSIQAPNATEFAFDGGSIAITNVTFLMHLKLYAINGYITSSNVKTLEAAYSNLLISGCTLTNTDSSLNGWTFQNCIVRFAGSAQNADLTEDGTNNSFISLTSSFMIFGITYRSTTHRYAYGLSAHSSIITSASAQFNNLKTRSVNGVQYSGFATSVFLGTSGQEFIQP